MHSSPNEEITGNVDVTAVAALIGEDTVGAVSEFLVRKQWPSFTLPSGSHIDAVNHSDSVAVSAFALVVDRSSHPRAMVHVEVLSPHLPNAVFHFYCLTGRNHPSGGGILGWTPFLDVVEVGSREFFLAKSNELGISMHSEGGRWILVVFFHHLDVALRN